MRRSYVFTTEDGVDKYDGDNYVFLNTSCMTYGDGVVMKGMEKVKTLKFDSKENAAVKAAQLIIDKHFK